MISTMCDESHANFGTSLPLLCLNLLYNAAE